MRNLIILLSDKLQKCWLCRHTFMANSPLVATRNRVAHPGVTLWTKPKKKNRTHYAAHVAFISFRPSGYRKGCKDNSRTTERILINSDIWICIA
jgi:hypothetical protein